MIEDHILNTHTYIYEIKNLKKTIALTLVSTLIYFNIENVVSPFCKNYEHHVSKYVNSKT